MLLPRPSLPARTTLWAAPLLVLVLAGAPLQAQETFTNLQFFPEDITRGELIGEMREFAFALGVRCTYCHAGEEGVPFNQRDWASDEKATKRKAREMLAMARDINQRYLAFLPDRGDPPVAVTCATCHGGVPRPEAIDVLVERTVETEGVDAAETKYRELRERFHGTAAYNFREQPLVELGSRLARAERFDAAERMLLLNLEFNPESAQSMTSLGQLFDRQGDVERAVEWYRRSLEAAPENAAIRRRLDQLIGG